MKTVRLTTKQFNDVIQSYPKEDLPYKVGGYPIRNQDLHKLPRYFENNLVGYLEDSKTLDDYLEDYSLITSSVLPLVAKELEKLYGQEAKK